MAMPSNNPADGTSIRNDKVVAQNSRKIQINRIALLEFYDTIPNDSRGHASALVAVAGEDLGAGLLKHYLEIVTNAKVEILPDPCTMGTQKGNRLDRWILVKRENHEILYQVEIKNSSAHAIGGKKLALNASSEHIAMYKQEAWAKYWNESSQELNGTARKVLLPMKAPGEGTVVPLLCVWPAMHRTGALEPFFEMKLPKGSHFEYLHVFSMSAYLRTLPDAYIEIEMPHTLERMNWLNRLFEVNI